MWWEGSLHCAQGRGSQEGQVRIYAHEPNAHLKDQMLGLFILTVGRLIRIKNLRQDYTESGIWPEVCLQNAYLSF